MRAVYVVLVCILISLVSCQSFRVNPNQKPKQCNVRNPFTNAQIVDALYWHNKPRRERAKAGQCANMLEVIWDHNVAAVAQNWADRCPPGHNDNRKSDYGRCNGEGNNSGSLGENWAMVSGLCSSGAVTEESGACSGGNCSDERCSMQNMIYKMWVNSEGGATGCFPFPKGGHCTQVVWGNSEFVGCGLSHCPGGRFDQTILLCNYAPPGNRNLPNKNCVRGTACSKCPSTHSHCNDGLCSRFANNGGNGGGSQPKPKPQPTRPPQPTRRPGTCTAAPVVFAEDKACGGREAVSGHKTEATNTPEKCQEKVLTECTNTEYFTFRAWNNACHCVEETNCNSPVVQKGLTVYKVGCVEDNPQPVTPATNFVKKSGAHCYNERLTGSDSSATTLDEAKQLCSNNSQCDAVYDSSCDNQGTFWLCKKGFTPANSKSSCIYRKNGGGNSNNDNNNRNNHNNNNTPTGSCPSKCKNSRKFKDTCKKCVSSSGWCGSSSAYCSGSRSTDCRQCGSSSAPTQPPRKNVSGNTCETKGNCLDTVDKCGKCIYTNQCKGNMYCCPFMKKCVENGSTACYYPIAECRPPCSEGASGYPGSCKCNNNQFPNSWMTSNSEVALAEETDLRDTEESIDHFRAMGEPAMVVEGAEEHDQIRVGSMIRSTEIHHHHNHDSQFGRILCLFLGGVVCGFLGTGIINGRKEEPTVHTSLLA